jgi:TfoX/Sxy family transcriptional regulator of competence genes
MPAIPKPDEPSKEFFRSVVPVHPAVAVRPMFGNLAAFANGNMFMGLFGSELFLRLSEADRSAVVKAGGGPFEPMPGRAMSGYVTVPAAWRAQPKRLTPWVTRSLDLAMALPPKERKPAKAPTKKG